MSVATTAALVVLGFTLLVCTIAWLRARRDLTKSRGQTVSAESKLANQDRELARLRPYLRVADAETAAREITAACEQQYPVGAPRLEARFADM